MKFFIIAGEASGDLHGSALVKEIKKLQPDARFYGIGGDRMKNEGVELFQHYRDIAFMGFKEVILHIGIIMKTMRACKKSLLTYSPDAVILIDYPGFNLRMASFAKKSGFKVIYYISPQIWAWKEKRIYTIKRCVDKMITILPFEKEYYKKWDYEVEYVGHPLMEVIAEFKADPGFLQKYNLDNRPVIAILPGSRQQEIEKILPEIPAVMDYFPDFQFVIGASSNFTPDYYYKFLNGKQIKLVFEDTYNLLSIAKAGIITSGTATLEAALFELPLVVCYKTTGLTYSLSKALIKIKFISLVNLISNKMVVKELIQKDLNTRNLKLELSFLLNDKIYRDRMTDNLKMIRKLLGEIRASKTAARIVFDESIY